MVDISETIKRPKTEVESLSYLLNFLFFLQKLDYPEK